MNIYFKDLMLNAPLLIKDSYGNKRAELYFNKGNYVTIHDIDSGESHTICKEHIERIMYQLYGVNLFESLNISQYGGFKKNGKKRI